MLEGYVKLKEFENYYINKDGNIVKLEEDGRVRTLSARLNKNGYYRVSMVLPCGRRVDRAIHKLIMETFVENKEGHRCINHIDGDKTNNKLSNLEWCSHSYNTWHMHNVLDKHTSIQKCDLYYLGEYVKSFDSIQEACEYAKETYKASYYSLQKYFTSNGCALIKKSVTTIP